MEQDLKYFLTISYGEGEVSVFIDTSPDFIFGDKAGLLVADTSRVEFVVHPRSVRGLGSLHDSSLSEHPLVIGEAREDLEPDEEDPSRLVPYSGHKFGGAPYCVHGEPSLEGPVESALKSGFVHLLQIDGQNVEGDDDDVQGDWPVGTALFHILVKGGGGESAPVWLCFWEQ